MILYLLKFSLCLFLLWSFYKLVLEKERIHCIKRFYLLFSLLFALTVPLLTFTYETEIAVESEMIPETMKPIIMQSGDIPVAEESTNYVPIILWSLYLVGVFVFGFRFIRNLIDISKKIRRNEKLKEHSHINVLVSNSIVPHTFLTYIFVPKKEFQQRNIPEEVLLHEKTHVVQKHTLDILFVEVLQIAFWFNPLFILIKKSMKLNHEFLADQSVLKQQFSIQNYFNLLLNYPNSPNQAVLSSSINYSLTKKRLQMMTKEFSKKRVALKLMALIPLLVVCTLFFNNEIVAKEIEKEPRFIRGMPVMDSSVNEPLLTISKNRSADENIIAVKRFQDGVTDEMVAEYNIWAKNLNGSIKNNERITIRKKELDRMKYIYKNLSSSQLETAEKFPQINIPPPPEVPEVMNDEESDIPSPPTPEEPESIIDYEERIQEENERAIQKQEAAEIAMMEAVENIHHLEEQAQIMAEKALDEAEEQRVVAMEVATLARMRAEEQRAIAMEESALAREQSIELAALARIRAEERAYAVSAKALEQSKYAEKKARKAARRNAEIKRKYHREAKKSAEIAREAAMAASKDAHSAMMNAKKEAMKARKEAHKAAVAARKEAMRSRPKPASPIEFVKKMEERGNAEFYYKGKRISYKEAKRLMNTSNNLSINAKTKNGKTIIKIKN